jgi:cysteine desulfurase
MIYFDSAGSYKILDEVIQTINEANHLMYANPSSSHLLGENQEEKIEKTRSLIADSIGCFASEIIFTSGATESNNIALKQILNEKSSSHIITCATEHKCVLSIVNYIQRQGHDVTVIKPNENGIIDLETIKSAIKTNTKMISVMHVNNELGTINPISEIGKFCFDNNFIFHTDAAQSYGKIKIDVDNFNIDMMSISAHKIGGPKGIGALYVRDLRFKDITPVIHGAGQEQSLRGGTLPTPLILGFKSAINNFPALYNNKNFELLRNYFLNELDKYQIKYTVNGYKGLYSIVSITFININISLFLRVTSNIFAIAQGSACSSKEIEASHVLSAIGLNRDEAEQTLRISFDHLTEVTDIEKLVMELTKYKL